jgi:hypothetical protein
LGSASERSGQGLGQGDRRLDGGRHRPPERRRPRRGTGPFQSRHRAGAQLRRGLEPTLYPMGRFAKSSQDIDKVLALEPWHFRALSGLGLCDVGLGRDREALAAFPPPPRRSKSAGWTGADRGAGKAADQRFGLDGITGRPQDLATKVGRLMALGRPLQKWPAYLPRLRFEQFRPIAFDVADPLVHRPNAQHVLRRGRSRAGTSPTTSPSQSSQSGFSMMTGMRSGWGRPAARCDG